MKTFFKGIVTVTVLFLMLCCTSDNKLILKATNDLQQIKQLIDLNSYDSAKNLIDSFHVRYRKLIDSRKVAQSYSDTITRRECSRMLMYCDSILPVKILEADELMHQFQFEKNTNYQDDGNYVHTSQLTEHNSHRIYLKYFFDEKANLFLISNFTGSKIEHTSVKVSANGLFVETKSLTTSHANYHTYSDGERYWEKLTFDSITENKIVEFIVQNATNKINVTLSGKKSYEYLMTEKDKNAIQETYKFWRVKKDILVLESKKKKALQKLERIKLLNSI